MVKFIFLPCSPLFHLNFYIASFYCPIDPSIFLLLFIVPLLLHSLFLFSFVSLLFSVFFEPPFSSFHAILLHFLRRLLWFATFLFLPPVLSLLVLCTLTENSLFFLPFHLHSISFFSFQPSFPPLRSPSLFAGQFSFRFFPADLLFFDVSVSASHILCNIALFSLLFPMSHFLTPLHFHSFFHFFLFLASFYFVTFFRPYSSQILRLSCFYLRHCPFPIFYSFSSSYNPPQIYYFLLSYHLRRLLHHSRPSSLPDFPTSYVIIPFPISRAFIPFFIPIVFFIFLHPPFFPSLAILSPIFFIFINGLSHIPKSSYRIVSTVSFIFPHLPLFSLFSLFLYIFHSQSLLSHSSNLYHRCSNPGTFPHSIFYSILLQVSSHLPQTLQLALSFSLDLFLLFSTFPTIYLLLFLLISLFFLHLLATIIISFSYLLCLRFSSPPHSQIFIIFIFLRIALAISSSLTLLTSSHLSQTLQLLLLSPFPLHLPATIIISFSYLLRLRFSSPPKLSSSFFYIFNSLFPLLSPF